MEKPTDSWETIAKNELNSIPLCLDNGTDCMTTNKKHRELAQLTWAKIRAKQVLCLVQLVH